MATKIPKNPIIHLLTRSLTTESRTQKLERIATELLDLTKLEMQDYGILFSHKMGFNKFGPQLPASAMSAGKGDGKPVTAVAKEEKTVFDVKLEKYDGAAKIKIIKEVRGFTDLGLKEAKELVEKVPAVLKKGLSKEEADVIVDKLKQLGATAVVQ